MYIIILKKIKYVLKEKCTIKNMVWQTAKVFPKITKI